MSFSKSLKVNTNFKVSFDGLSEDDNGEYESYTLTASDEGVQLGFLTFKAYGSYVLTSEDKYEDLSGKHVLFITDLEVHPAFRSTGVATSLYTKLCELYVARFKGWMFVHHFHNPIAEFIITRLISECLVFSHLLDYRFVSRTPNAYSKDLVDTLRSKLPDKFRASFARGY